MYSQNISSEKVVWPQNPIEGSKTMMASSSSKSSISLPHLNFFEVVGLSQLKCPLSKQLIAEPRSLVPCGHTFDLHSLTRWYIENKIKVCPSCSTPFTEMVVNIAQKQIMTTLNKKLNNSVQTESLVDKLFNKLPNCQEKEKIKLGIDLYKEGQPDLGSDLIIEILINTTDIALKEQISELLSSLIKASEEKSRMLFESTDDGMAIDTNPSTSLDDTEDSACKLPNKHHKQSFDHGDIPQTQRSKTISSQNTTPTSQENRVELEPVLAESEEAPLGKSQRFKLPAYPLHQAIKSKWNMSDTLVLINKSNANSKDEAGNTPLHLVSVHLKSVSAILHRLFECGAKVNERNNNGDTPLHLAAKYSRKTVIVALRNQSANPLIKNNDGKTPLDLASTVEAKKTMSSGWVYQT